MRHVSMMKFGTSRSGNDDSDNAKLKDWIWALS
jgi:hypothetical protein